MVQNFLVPRKVHISLEETFCVTCSSDFSLCCFYFPSDFYFFFILFPVRQSNTCLALVGKGQQTSKKGDIKNKVSFVGALRKWRVCWWDQTLAVQDGRSQRDRSGNLMLLDLLEQKRWTEVANRKCAMFLFLYFKGHGPCMEEPAPPAWGAIPLPLLHQHPPVRNAKM